MTESVVPLYKIEQNQEEFNAATTTSINLNRNRFSCKPSIEVRSIRSVSQISAKGANATTKSYYLPSSFLSEWNLSLPPRLYQLRTLDEESQEVYTDDIVVGVSDKSIVEQNISLIPSSATHRKWGQYLTSLNSPLSKHIPRSRFEVRATDFDEDEQIWRGTFPLSHKARILFSEEIEVKVDELSGWKPHIVIDSYRLEDDDE